MLFHICLNHLAFFSAIKAFFSDNHLKCQPLPKGIPETSQKQHELPAYIIEIVGF